MLFITVTLTLTDDNALPIIFPHAVQSMGFVKTWQVKGDNSKTLN